MNTNLSEYQHKCPYYEVNCAELQCPCPKWLAYADLQDPEIVAEEISKMGIDPKADALTIMMSMQANFAVNFHPITNLTKQEMDHWIDRYLVCMDDELREVREHLAWKPWETANVKDNLPELKKELIDIWHFLMDTYLVAGLDATKLFETYFENYVDNLVEIGTAANFKQMMSDSLNFVMLNETNWMKKQQNMDNLSKDDRDWSILFYHNCFQDAEGKIRQEISWKHWKKPSDTTNYDRLYVAFAEAFKYFVNMMILVGMTADEWKTIYVNKNIENCRRQYHGY